MLLKKFKEIEIPLQTEVCKSFLSTRNKNYKEAKDELTRLIRDKCLTLKKDISEVDKYDRLLRYVYVGELFVNDMLVKNGYAQANEYPPDTKYADLFEASELGAKEQKLVIWSEIMQDSASNDDSTVDIVCSSNVYNCDDFKTHLEAQSVFETCGGTSNDVHQLDQDKDGKVCESLK